MDSSPVILKMLTCGFQDAGWETVTATNGLEAVNACYRTPPDIAVIDFDTAVLNGAAICRFIKSRRELKKIPVIISTTEDDSKTVFWSLSSGAAQIVIKDVDNTGELLSAAEELRLKEPLDQTVISGDYQNLDNRRLLEAVSAQMDHELFKKTLLSNMTGLIHANNLESTVEELFELFRLISDSTIAVMIINKNNTPSVFSRSYQPLESSREEDFIGICMAGFREYLPDLSLEGLIKKRIDSEDHSIEKGEPLNSYLCVPLSAPGGEIFATFHCASRLNNCYTPLIQENIKLFCQNSAYIIKNILHIELLDSANKKLRIVFSKFIPLEVIDELLEQDHAGSMTTGEKRDVVVLFSDIRSFTAISENNSAEQVVGFLNRYFEAMVKIITGRGGTIDKFIGDAILAVFGAPKSYPDNELRAVTAALEMEQALKEIDTGDLTLPHGGFATGIGIHSGPAIVGNIGSRDKYDYTVIGDTVNLASRLEGLTKHYSQQLLISQDVVNRLDSPLQLLEIDTVKVKGKELPTSLFTAWNSETPLLTREQVEIYQKALLMYKMKNWHIAREYFEKLQLSNPHFKLTQLYIQRCTDFIAQPPPDNWDGANAFDHK